MPRPKPPPQTVIRLRLDRELCRLADKQRGKRSRNTWIQEAVAEKLARESK